MTAAEPRSVSRLRVGFRVGPFPKISETFILKQIFGLADRGHDVFVLAERAAPATDSVAERIKTLAGVAYLEPAGGPAAFAYSRLPYRIQARRQTRAEQRLCDQCDVVVCNFGWYGRGMAESRRSDQSTKIVTIFHGADLSKTIEESSESYYRSLFADGDLFLGISDFWRTRLKELGAPAEKVGVHRMGIELAEFADAAPPATRTGPFKFLSVGRLVEKKGIEFAIRALGRLTAPSELRIIGDGPLMKDLKTLVASLGLEGRVTFLGSQPHETVRAEMLSADAFLLPSVTAASGDMEGIPVALMEAMASRRPVISTYHSGIPELITNGETGRLVKERDVDGLAEAMAALVSDPGAMLDAARAQVETKFNNDILNDQFATLLANLRDQDRLEATA
ncbi:MAG: glycosyltransferase [Pseudomonadota bacterium]